MLHVSRKGMYNDISWKWGMIVAHVRYNRVVICDIYNKLFLWMLSSKCGGIHTCFVMVHRCFNEFSVSIGNVYSLKYRIFMRHYDLWGMNDKSYE